LVFDGPIEILLWVSALAGVVAVRVSARGLPLASLRDPRWAPWIAGGLLLVGSLCAAVTIRDQIPGGDEPHYLVITQSLLYDGDLRIENNHQRGDYAEYLAHDIEPDYLQRGRDGEIYSIHAPGISALLLPAFAVGGHAGSVVLIALMNALAVGLMWRTAYLAGRSITAAWVATLAIVGSAPFFFHAFTIYPEPAGAVVVSYVLFTLVRLDVTPNAVRAHHLALTGAALALLPWLHTRFAIVAGTMGTVLVGRLVARRQRWRDLGAFASIPVVSAVAWFAFFTVIYGTPDPTAPYGASRQTSLGWIPAGLTGLFIDQQFGLLTAAPALAFAGVGLIIMCRKRSRLVLEHLLVIGPYVLSVAAFGMWWGGWSAPARFLVVLLPLCVLPLAHAWLSAGMAARLVLVALTALGAANVVARAAMQNGALIYNVRDGFDRLLDAAASSVSLPLAFPSVHRLGVETSLVLGVIYALAVFTVWLVVDLWVRARARTLGGQWTVTVWAMIAALLIAETASWRVARTAPLTIAESKLAFVQKWQPERRPLAVILPPLHVTTGDRVLHQLALDTPRSLLRRDEQPLLALARVPAGDYRLLVEGDSDADGEIDVAIGPTSQPTEHWSLRAVAVGDAARLHLPAAVHSITIRGDASAQSAVRRITLRPEHIVPTEHFVRRAARYGSTRVFCLDDGLFMESGGIWTRGDNRADVIVATDRDDDVEFTVAAGPVAVTLTLATETAAQTVDLAPGEARRLRLPAGRWSITTAGRFRPRDYDEGNRDSRVLGIRIEF
jgi:hypothetical protein